MSHPQNPSGQGLASLPVERPRFLASSQVATPAYLPASQATRMGASCEGVFVSTGPRVLSARLSQSQSSFAECPFPSGPDLNGLGTASGGSSSEERRRLWKTTEGIPVREVWALNSNGLLPPEEGSYRLGEMQELPLAQGFANSQQPSYSGGHSEAIYVQAQAHERRLLTQQSCRHAAEDSQGKASPQRRALLNELRASYTSSPPPTTGGERLLLHYQIEDANSQHPQQQPLCRLDCPDPRLSSQPPRRPLSALPLRSHQIQASRTSSFSKPPLTGDADWGAGGRSRAVVIGCSYCKSTKYALWGPANDACLFAHALVHLLGLAPDDVLLMTDALPAECYGGGVGRGKTRGVFDSKAKDGGTPTGSAPSSAQQQPRKVKGLVLHPPVDVEDIEAPEPNPSVETQPTRHNMLIALKWLVKDALPGDRLFFYFSGLSTQVDNLNAYEGEGYDEALLPCDFEALTADEDPAVLLTTQIKEILLSAPPAVHVSMFLDTCGGQTILDPAGTGSVLSFIKGVKQKGIWPFLTNPTNRMQRAAFNAKVWTDANMQAQRVRPRYLPGFAVSGVSASRCPLLSQSAAPLSSSNNAFLIAAAPWGQVAVEAAFLSIALPVRVSRAPFGNSFAPALAATQGGVPVVHGVLTWALVSALLSLFGPQNKSDGRRVSYEQMLTAVRDRVRDLKWNRLFELDQFPELTIHTGGAASFDSPFFVPGWPPSFSGGRPSDSRDKDAAAATMGCCAAAERAAASAASACQTCAQPLAFLSAEDAWLSLTGAQNSAGQGSASLCSLSSQAGGHSAPWAFGPGQVAAEGVALPAAQINAPEKPILTTADCCRFLPDSRTLAPAAAESGYACGTFAPATPLWNEEAAQQQQRQGDEASAALQQHPPCEEGFGLEHFLQRDRAAWVDACSSSGVSEVAASPQGPRVGDQQPPPLSVLYTPGSAVLMSPRKQAVQQRLLLSPRQGVWHSTERRQYISEKEAAARRAEKQAAEAAKREVYVQLASHQVAQNASAEAANAAAANAAYLQQQIKLRDVAPQADALGEHVKEQQRAAMLLQELNPPLLLKQHHRGKRSKTPVYPATLVPIYEATRD